MASKLIATFLLTTALSGLLTTFAYINRSQAAELDVSRICALLLVFSSCVVAVSGLAAPMFLKSLSHSSTADPFMNYLMRTICSKMRLKPPKLYLSNSTSGFNAFQVGISFLSSLFLIGNPMPIMNSSDIEAVLAHELSHIKLKHGLKMLFNIILFITLLAFADFYLATPVLKQSNSIYLGFSAYLLFNAMGAASILLALLALKRKFELQADFLAACTCGFEQYLQAMSKVYGQGVKQGQCATRMESLLSGHPCYYERIVELQKRFAVP